MPNLSLAGLDTDASHPPCPTRSTTHPVMLLSCPPSPSLDPPSLQVWVPNLSLAGPDPDEEKLVTVAATKCLTESGDVYGTRPLWEQLRAALDEKLKGA